MSSDSTTSQTLPEAELSALVDELEASYWVPLLKTPFSVLETVEAEAEKEHGELSRPLTAFHSNLRAARDLLEFPYLLIGPLLPEVRDAIRNEIEQELDQGLSARNSEATIQFVTAILRGSKMRMLGKDPLQRLMHQACILVWSAVETLCKDIFIASVNKRPALYSVIQGNPKLKERFSISQSALLGHLENHNFDLNGKLGTVIAADKDFSSPTLICELIPALFTLADGPGFPVDVFEKDALWRLGHRRHLIAHRCGIVDRDYLNKTADDAQVSGSLLKLRGRDIAEAMGAVASFAILLYGNSATLWAADQNGPTSAVLLAPPYEL